MSENSWERSRRSLSRRWFAVCAAAVALVAIIFIRNNIGSSESVRQGAEEGDRSTVSMRDVDRAAPDEEPAGMAAEEDSSGDSGHAVSESVRGSVDTGEVLLSNIACAIRDKPELTVRISLKAFTRGTMAKKELLFKRDDLKVMAREVLAKKSLDEVTVEALRPELKTAMNRILDHGGIHDVEFMDFMIE